MSISTEISRLQADRNTIRAKLVELGMATGTDNLTALANAIKNLADRGAVKVEVKEGESYTIPAGYHNGSGTVSGVSGGGNYNLQEKSVVPTKQQQNVTAGDGYYGLSAVTVAPIPDKYVDTTDATAAAANILDGKTAYVNGAKVEGTMANLGSATMTMDGLTQTSITVGAGYTSGGTISLTSDIEDALAAI